MVKSKGAKRGKNRKAKKRLAVHIKEANGKRAAAATGDDQGVAHRGPLLASPLGVGRPSAGNKRPRQTGGFDYPTLLGYVVLYSNKPSPYLMFHVLFTALHAFVAPSGKLSQPVHKMQSGTL